jgi:hypothetical protein
MNAQQSAAVMAFVIKRDVMVNMTGIRWVVKVVLLSFLFSLLPLLRKKSCVYGILSVCVYPAPTLYLLKQFTGFYEIWY